MYQQIPLGHKEKQHKPKKFIFCCLYIIRCWLRRTRHTPRWKKVVVPSIFRRLEIFEAVSSSMHKETVTIHKHTQAFIYPWFGYLAHKHPSTDLPLISSPWGLWCSCHTKKNMTFIKMPRVCSHTPSSILHPRFGEPKIQNVSLSTEQN